MGNNTLLNLLNLLYGHLTGDVLLNGNLTRNVLLHGSNMSNWNHRLHRGRWLNDLLDDRWLLHNFFDHRLDHLEHHSKIGLMTTICYGMFVSVIDSTNLFACLFAG